MRIGVDARIVATQKAGIGHYVSALLRTFHEVDRENEYFLYTIQHFSLPFENPRFRIRVISAPNIPWWMQVSLPRAVRDDRIDLFWGGNYYLPLRPGAMKTIITVHDFVYARYPRTLPRRTRWHLRLMMPRYLSRSDRAIVDSESTAQDLRTLYRYPSERIRVIPLAAREEFFRPASEVTLVKFLARYHLTGGYSLFVGTLEPRKGLDILVRAYAQLRAETSYRKPLVVVGKYGWGMSTFPRLLRELSLGDSVRILPYLNDEELPLVYRGADLFVYPSHYEGFGLPVLEAMACGVPVLTSRVSSLPEVGGEAAHYISPGDSEGLAREMATILFDETLRESMRQRGLEQVRRFSWTETGRRTLAVFREITSS